MKTLTTEQRNILWKKSGGDKSICSRFQNVEYMFQNGLTFSRTGMYAPTFRIKTDGGFDSKSNALFIPNLNSSLGVLASKMFKYLFKNFLCHTVQAEGDAIEEVILPILEGDALPTLVKQIIVHQQASARYDYGRHEQLAIDGLVYAAYGLSAGDIAEVETWYARRYPRLSAAQSKKQ